MPTKRVKSLPEVRKLHLGIGNIKRRTGCAGSPKCVLTETHGGFREYPKICVNLQTDVR